MAERDVTFRVFRYKQGETAPRYDMFTVRVHERTTVLEALQAIRREQDGTLMFRHSCHHASCGTCGMRVNGREVLACVTRVADLGPEVTVEPLENAPLVTDLVVDMAPFYGRFTQAEMPLLRASEALRGRAEPPEEWLLPTGREEGRGAPGYERFENCIECGLCLSACPVVASDPLYLGPAALAAAWRVVEEPRGRETAQVLRRVDDEHGCWRCHLAFECSEVCPSAVEPGHQIMRLRRRLLLDR